MMKNQVLFGILNDEKHTPNLYNILLLSNILVPWNLIQLFYYISTNIYICITKETEFPTKNELGPEIKSIKLLGHKQVAYFQAKVSV